MQAVRDMEQRGVVGASSVYYELACCLCSFGRWQDAMVEVSFFPCNAQVFIVLGLMCLVWSKELCALSVDVTYLVTSVRRLVSFHWF